jgi:DNA polymerase III delta prime subunit
MNILEKYKPKNLNEIIGQDYIIDFLKKTIETKYFNHYIFYGLPGCGKTSTSFLYIKELYGKNYNNHIFEINASNFRGIKIFKNEINNFISNNNNKDKTIILDEADNITIDAQHYLFQLIEKASNLKNNINFIIICNYINKINLKIINKCILLRFKLISNNCLKKKINFVVNKENIEITEKDKKLLIKKSNNDFRKCLNNLELIFIKNFKMINDNKINLILNILLTNNDIINKFNQIEKIIDNNKINLINLIEKITIRLIERKKKNYTKKKFCEILIKLYKLQKSLYSDYNLKIQLYYLVIIF